METKKQLYPLKFIPIPSKRIWGGSNLIKKLGKEFYEAGEDGSERKLTADEAIGESWEIADMGVQDSVVANGWLAGNTISELMETYLDRIVGEDVYNRYGRQFPLLIKFLDIQNKLSVQVHPDDEVAEQRYDSLGKSEIWYVLDAAEDAKVYAGFNREISAQELYDRCHNGTVEEVLNVLHPKKGDAIRIVPGTIHAADGGLLIAEIQESSDLTFRLYDWGREFNPKTARKMHLDEAIDLINYSKFDESLFIKGPLWGDEYRNDSPVRELAKCPQFTVNEMKVSTPLQISKEKFNGFLIYMCIEGGASIQVSGPDGKGGRTTESTEVHKGDTVLVPADMPDFTIVPTERDTLLVEAMVERQEEVDSYINPETEPYLEGEDYEGIDKEDPAE